MYSFFSLNGLDSKDFFEFREWTNLNFPKHCHYTFEAVFVTEGNVTIEKDNQAYTLFPNDGLAIMPFEQHKFITETHSNLFIFQISPNLISNFDSLFKNKTLKNPRCHFPAREIVNLYEHLKLADNNIIEINYVFFTAMSAFLCNNELIYSHEHDDLFRKAVLYASNHFEESICLKDIAEELYVSYVYLSRLFTKKSGMKFNDFLNSFRLQKSTSLLADPSIPISKICYICGWGSLRNFNRVFLKTMACTPSEFRQKQNS